MCGHNPASFPLRPFSMKAVSLGGWLMIAAAASSSIDSMNRSPEAGSSIVPN
jgi:hypothetical protein